MKKLNSILCVIFGALFCFVFAACADGNDGGAGNGAEDNNVLVAYFSKSGNTRRLAEIIADNADADIFEIVPQNPYPASYNETTARAREELDNETRVEISSHMTAAEMGAYDVIYLGFPIWWHDLPMPVWTFLEEYDFSDKTIIPFFTHGGSSTGDNSLPRIQELCPNSTVLTDDYFQVSGSGAGNATTAVQNWLNGLASESLVFSQEDGAYTVTDVGDEKVVMVPAVHQGLPVTKIQGDYGTGAFARKDMLAVIIPDSVTEIGQNTFSNCSELKHIKIGANSNLKTIGRNAFSGCASLENIFIPASTQSILDGAFNNCGAINFNVAGDNSVYRAENGHLIERATDTLIRGGQSGIIPNGVEIIAQAAFRRNSAITELTIPVSVTAIGNYIIADTNVEKIAYAGTDGQWESIQKSGMWNFRKTDVQIQFGND